MSDSSTPQPNSSHPLLSLVLRVFWMLVGNAAVFACYIAMKREDHPGVYDLGYWALAAALLGARYVDIAVLRGETSDGRPATMKDFRNYALILSGVAAVGYIFAWFTRG